MHLDLTNNLAPVLYDMWQEMMFLGVSAFDRKTAPTYSQKPV